MASLAYLSKRRTPLGRMPGVGTKRPAAPKAPSFIPQGPAQVAPALQQLVAPPAATPPPAAPAVSPNGNVSTPQDVDPRDSIYGVGIASLLGQVQGQRRAIQAAGEADNQGFNENLGRIATNRSASLDANQTNANRQGLFYSGILGKRQGDTNAQYDDQINQNRSALNGREAARRLQLQQVGDLTADPNSPYGYSATGDAGTSFYNLLRGAADRRVATAADAAPAADPAAPAATTAAPGPTPPLNHTGPTAKLPVYHATKPGAAKPKVAKPGPIHGSSKVTLTRKK